MLIRDWTIVVGRSVPIKPCAKQHTSPLQSARVNVQHPLQKQKQKKKTKKQKKGNLQGSKPLKKSMKKSRKKIISKSLDDSWWPSKHAPSKMKFL